MKQKSKVSIVDIKIKLSLLLVSNPKVFSSILVCFRELMFHIPDILVSPCIETNSVMAVGRKDVYLNPNFISRYDGGQVSLSR